MVSVSAEVRARMPPQYNSEAFLLEQVAVILVKEPLKYCAVDSQNVYC
jgi:hypothetical protein